MKHARTRCLKLLALVLTIALTATLWTAIPVSAAKATPIPAKASGDEAQAVETAGPGDEPFDEDAYIQEEEDLGEEGQPLDIDPEEAEFLNQLLGEIDIPDNALDVINGYINILLVGIDARPNEKTGRSDTMIIMTLDREHNCIKLTSLMRDLYVEIPGHGSNRLNAAYVWGGPELLKKTIKKNFGVEMNYYVTVNFTTLADVIDQLGGIELTVEKKYLPRINAVIKMDNKALKQKINSGLIAEPGTQVLTGRQALGYARYRYGTTDGDSGRNARQREIILKVIDMIKGKSLLELGSLALKNIDKVSTDMSLGDMLRLAPAVFEMKDGAVRELRIPIDRSWSNQKIKGMAVIVPNRSKNAKALATFIASDPAETPQVTQKPIQ